MLFKLHVGVTVNLHLTGSVESPIISQRILLVHVILDNNKETLYKDPWISIKVTLKLTSSLIASSDLCFFKHLYTLPSPEGISAQNLSLSSLQA